MEMRISATGLSEFARGEYCPSCEWVRLHLPGHKFPFDIFPGVFSSLDHHYKQLIRRSFRDNSCAPEWMAQLSSFTELADGLIIPGTWKAIDQKTGVKVTGIPDEVLIQPDSTCAIIDYKTAKYTDTQQLLLPKYTAQLNTYCWLAEQNKDIPPVSHLALLYMEPVVLQEEEGVLEFEDSNRVWLKFAPRLIEVEKSPILVPRLLREAQRLLETSKRPKMDRQCKNCLLLEELGQLI